MTLCNIPYQFDNYLVLKKKCHTKLNARAFFGTYTMARLISLGILFCFVSCCFGTKCFECQYVQYPHDCLKITVCNSDEVCFTEQVVTPSRNVAFNSGCRPKTKCPPISRPLFGKRSTSIVSSDSTDILTCTECCASDFCNVKGCGTHAIRKHQRGPYCYTCDVQDPNDCTNVTVCNKNELCMLYHPLEVNGRPGTMYRSQCETEVACNTLSQAFGSQNCHPLCCNTDFCNDRCGTISNIPMTTSDGNKYTATTMQHLNSVSTPGKTPSSTHSYCKGENFVNFAKLNAHVKLCIHIVNGNQLSWDKARAWCKERGDDLVVLDTNVKALLVRDLLRTHHQYNHTLYWIGAKDFNNDNHFSWVNGQSMVNTETDWGGGEPDHVLNNHNQDCVGMHYRHATNARFKWFDMGCNAVTQFICERKQR